MITKAKATSGKRSRDRPAEPGGPARVIRTFVRVLETIDARSRPDPTKPKEAGR